MIPFDPADPVVGEWESHPKREVWVVDETKIPPPAGKEEHKEIFVYSIVRTVAWSALQLMHEADAIRATFPPDDPNRDSFKSGELWRAFRAFTTDGSQAELRQACRNHRHILE